LPDQFFSFPVGTMFWARSAALESLFSLGLDWDDYPPEPLPIDGSMLHALERLLPSIVEHAGYGRRVTFAPGVSR
jgi:lipopolysaccharide biosynthesis protein